MFGMELWFVLALVSVIGGGTFIFATKVAAERDYDVVLLSTIAITLSLPGILVLEKVYGDGTSIGLPGITAASVIAVTFTAVNILRHRAMQCIDTAIYYPLYKTLTPALVIFSGVLLFSESFSSTEWLGLVLSLFVPLLLISKVENKRQKNLFLGLQLLLVTSLIAVIGVLATKYGLESSTNTWQFVLFSNTGAAISGAALMIARSGSQSLKTRVVAAYDRSFLMVAFVMSLMQITGYAAFVFAIKNGPLSIVYTINSLYILVPIILSIIYYHEHWNARKVVAIILSVAVLALLR